MAYKTNLNYSPNFDSKKRRQEMMDEGFSMTNPAFLASAKVVSATTNIPFDKPSLNPSSFIITCFLLVSHQSKYKFIFALL